MRGRRRGLALAAATLVAAVIVVVPGASVEARPAGLIEATVVSDDAHVTWLVRLIWELSV